MIMELEKLQELMQAGTEHTFRGSFGGRPEGARGVVERVGFPAAPNKVVIRDIVGNAHHWDARDMSMI